MTHGTNTEGVNECYGTYNSTTQTGSGPGYVNACIHSGGNEYSGHTSDPAENQTVWYNYAIASAGTIANKSSSDESGNLNTTTESICPKGWTLPSKKQLDDNRNTINFNQVLGGSYSNGALSNESTRGFWWGSETINNAQRYLLYYKDINLSTSGSNRRDGLYIRCVSEEKTVTDLTYLQDMTGEIANNTLDGTTASLTDRRDGKLYAVAKINGNMWMTQNLRFGYDSTNGAGNPTPGVSSLILTPDDSNIVLSADRLNPHGTPNDPSDDVAETVDGYRELTHM